MKNNNKTIVFISNGFGLSPALSGGEVRLFNLLKRIKNEFIPILFTTKGGNTALHNFIKKVNFSVINVKCSFIFNKEFFLFQRFWGYLISACDTFLKLKKFNLNAIYTSSDAICDIFPAYLVKKEKKHIKWFAMLHHKYKNPFLRPGNFIKNFFLYAMQNLTLKLVAKKADCIFVLQTKEGDLLKNFLLRKGCRGKIIKVKNGIDIEKNILRNNSKKDKKTSIYLGGIRAAKGLYDIVPIWKKIVINDSSLKLIIIGKGSESDIDFLKKEIKNNGLSENIKLAGYLSESELKKYLKKAYIFFFPSREEGWGISILESLKYNCIPLVYDLPAFKIFKKYIYTVPCFNKEIFAQKFIEIVKSKKKFYVNPSFIKKFSWDLILTKEIKLLHKYV